jgi:hypothetical protein
MTDDVKLYAGKFKTVEELEAGYNNAAKVYQENDDLKKKFDETTRVPDAYSVPTGIELHENDLEELKRSSKNSGLTQAQFDKLAFAQNEKVKSKVQSFENAKKEIGSDNLNLLQDFITKTYPQKAGEALMKEAIKNKEVREAILNQRTQALNSSVPGVNQVFSHSYNNVTHEDVIKARDVMTKSRGKARGEAQKRYIGLASKLAHAGE